MEIERIRVFRADLHLRDAYEHSSAILTTLEQVYLQIVSRDGLTGFAEVRGNCPYVTHESRRDIQNALRDEFVPLLERKGSADPEAVIALANKHIASHGARTLIDVALHDLSARSSGLAVCDYLGTRVRDEVMSFYTVGFAGLRETKRRTKAGADAGYRLFKVRVGMGEFSKDRERIQLIREIVPDKEIGIDANGAWGVQEAIDNINGLSAYSLAFVEQPVECDNFEGLKRVRENVDAPIMADESLMSIASLERLISEKAVDMVNIKVLKAGGLINTAKLIKMATAYGIPFLFGSMTTGRLDAAATLHAQCSIGANATYCSSGGFYEVVDDPTVGLEIREGRVSLPSGSGLGVSVDHGLLREEFTVSITRCK